MVRTRRVALILLSLAIWLPLLLDARAQSDPDQAVSTIVLFVTCLGDPPLRGSVQLTTTDQDGRERWLSSSCNAEGRKSTEHELTVRGESSWSAQVTVRGSTESRTCEESGIGLPISLWCELDGDAVELESRGGVSAADIPSPEECRTPPRDLDALLALAESPADVGASTVGMIFPGGEPADEETVSAVQSTMRELLACYNAGAFLRAFSLYTDEYFRRFFDASGPYHRDVIDHFAKPAVPRPDEERLALLETRNARLLPDGRVRAIVIIDDPTVPGPEPQAFVVFARVGDR